MHSVVIQTERDRLVLQLRLLVLDLDSRHYVGVLHAWLAAFDARVVVLHEQSKLVRRSRHSALRLTAGVE